MSDTPTCKHDAQSWHRDGDGRVRCDACESAQRAARKRARVMAAIELPGFVIIGFYIAANCFQAAHDASWWLLCWSVFGWVASGLAVVHLARTVRGRR